MINYIARSNNGTYHRASHDRAHCNQRMYIGGKASDNTIAAAAANMFCEKCFPNGKPE
jgi:hypothetical protein